MPEHNAKKNLRETGSSFMSHSNRTVKHSIKAIKFIYALIGQSLTDNYWKKGNGFFNMFLRILIMLLCMNIGA